MIYKQTTKKSFTQELILEKWLSLNSEEYTISKKDSDLFLRIVRQILLNSRDEQSKIVDIYSRIEKRNNEENEKLRNEITELRAIVQKQRETIYQICETFEIVFSACWDLELVIVTQLKFGIHISKGNKWK